MFLVCSEKKFKDGNRTTLEQVLTKKNICKQKQPAVGIASEKGQDYL